jgi:hypothetical protein
LLITTGEVGIESNCPLGVSDRLVEPSLNQIDITQPPESTFISVIKGKSFQRQLPRMFEVRVRIHTPVIPRLQKKVHAKSA